MIYELFSQRKKRRAQSGQNDVYDYDTVPEKLRVQMQQLLPDAIGPQYVIGPYARTIPPQNPDAWEFIEKTLRRENGVHSIGRGSTECEMVLAYLASAETDGFLDTMELCGRYIEKILQPYNNYERDRLGISQEPSQAIDEINFRFRDANVGFQYADGQLIRMDSDYTHEEIIKPALTVLAAREFAGPQAEFLQAHRHYRAGEYSQAITEAAKSFESTLKVACDLRGWPYPKGARASDLLKIVRQHGLWPDYLDASFDQLLATLASGLPKVRNEEGAHGQGANIRSTPDYVAGYALQLAGAKIRLIGEATKDRTS